MEDVTPRKRQRVARACDSCKSKKKQCSGTQPCAACDKKSSLCVFSAPLNHQRQQRDDIQQSRSVTNLSPHARVIDRESEIARDSLFHKPRSHGDDADMGGRGPQPPLEDVESEDATPIENEGRLLQDNGGRLVYLGDSATLSFLQTIRKLVEKKLGPSAFTTDVNRHKILEASITSKDVLQLNFALPNLESARCMVDSFFTNTAGLCDIFERRSFESKVSETYKHPLDADPQWLSHLNLVFAIGFQMRRDRSSTDNHAIKILDRLELPGSKRAERFYLAARQLHDPVADVEAGGMQELQSLILIMVYMLASSKRNSAWRYLGMAVNLSYALGVHKEETLPMFDSLEQERRRGLWQSVYVIDCFLATSLGRPNHVSCETASELCSTPSQSSHGRIMQAETAIFFAVKVSKIVGKVLSRVYHARKASHSIAYQLSLRFSEWLQQLPPDLHWRTPSFQIQDPALILKRLHINLIWFHGLIILTRPFFLHQICKQAVESEDNSTDRESRTSRTNPGRRFEHALCFDRACVRAALHSVAAVNNAFTADALPRRNPFVIYWLFSATLILLANSFSPVSFEADNESTIRVALNIMRFCGEADPQARRYQNILESFFEVIQQAEKDKEHTASDSSQAFDIFRALFETELSNIRDESSTQVLDRIFAAAISPPVASTGDHFQVPNEMGGLEMLSFASGINGRIEHPSSGMDGFPSDYDHSIAGTDIWWGDGQTAFNASADEQVPLYSLMDAI